MSYRIGIDAGSKTIKIIVMDQDDSVRYSLYRRHRSNITQTLRELLREINWILGDIDGPVAFTGSAGIGIAEEVGAPFIQEVVATTMAVQKAYPQADAIVELGGEDAKIIYLTGGIEQRMNASCAGGTGGFIDTIAFMLGVASQDMNRLALGCRHPYPIASRCAVFAQTDIRPLINAGVPKTDLAGSAFKAVVRQTLGGLACGRPIRGNVIFLGGPLEYNSALVMMFRKELGLNKTTGIKPKNAHLFTAIGTAWFAGEQPTGSLQLSELRSRLEGIDVFDDDLERLEPLFTDEDEVCSFRERHEMCTYPENKHSHAYGPLYLGVDAGSTTVKLAVLDQDGALVYHDYAQTEGDTAKTLQKMLLEMYRRILSSYAESSDQPIWFARSAVTGYGEDMIKALFGVDEGIVETAAHLRVALQVCPDVSFILDIGGQDMKALWVKDGVITDAVLNEACSSGCGSFIEGTAYSLKSNPSRFAERALLAQDPVDLGTRCTVFMTSRVRHAQKIGANVDDIAAGIAYSVVQNALFRIIGAERVASMGDRIMVQGGTFKSDAVLRAFERISGREVLRCNTSHLMGAIGAALTARDRAEEMQAAQNVDEGMGEGASEGAHDSMGDGANGENNAGNDAVSKSRIVSCLASANEIESMTFKRQSLECTGCANSCQLSMIHASDKRIFISGNRCSKGLLEPERREAASANRSNSSNSSNPSNQGETLASGISNSAPSQVSERFDATEQELVNASKPSDPPSVFARERDLLSAYEGTHEGDRRAQINIGLMNTLELYSTVPFWHGVLSALGFTVTVDAPNVGDIGSGAAWETIPSESVCYPAKLTHLRYFNLVQQDVDAVFMPQFDRHSHCVVVSSYAQALADNLTPEAVPLVAPQLSSYKPALIVEEKRNIALLKQALGNLAHQAGVELSDEVVRQALQAGQAEQRAHDEQIKRATEEVLQWLSADTTRRGVVLAGRSYHGDPAVSKGIDAELQKLSVAVLNMRGLNQFLREQQSNNQQRKPLEAQTWRAAKRLRSVAEFAAEHPQVDIVCLHSFGCGYDAVSFEEVSNILSDAEKPFTVLKIDDITDLAHIRIRLRTLIDAIKKRPVKSENASLSDDAEAIGSAKVNQEIQAAVADQAAQATQAAASTQATASTQAVTSAQATQATQAAQAAASTQATQAQIASFADARLDCDLELLRRHTVKDACYSAQTMAAHAIEALKDDPSVDTIELPLVCKDCLFDAVPLMVQRAVGRPLKVKWVDATGLCASSDKGTTGVVDAGSASSTATDEDLPRIGIVGNALLCYQPALNDNLVELLKSLGIQPVLPDPELIQGEDVRYEEQLARYAQSGITEVIYIQSFGCLKGHVQSRGALHQLKQKFPELNITVIDYDPEASALNRENRIRLVAESLKRTLATSLSTEK